jgi:hypothetical protein
MTRKSKALVPSKLDSKLDELAKTINAEHREAIGCLNRAVEHATRIGGLLLQAKKIAGHGKFMKWVAANCNMSHRTVNYYITCHENRAKLAKTANMALPATIIETVNAARTLPASEAKVERAKSRKENKQWREENKQYIAKAQADYERQVVEAEEEEKRRFEQVDVDPDVWIKLATVRALATFLRFTLDNVRSGQLRITGKTAKQWQEEAEHVLPVLADIHKRVEFTPQSLPAVNATVN